MDADNKRAEPWFHYLDEHPFNLEVKTEASHNFGIEPPVFRSVAVFPYNSSSLNKLWKGEYADEPTKVEQWQATSKKWSGVVAVGGGSKVRLFLSRRHQQYLPLSNITVPDVPIRFGGEETIEKGDVTCLAWTVVQSADEFWPILAFAANKILYLFNAEKGNFHGFVRGHGAKISSINVHPIDPSILASTSYDHTVRIYDITEKAQCKIDNPHWPGKPYMSLGGPAFGLRSNELEGVDYGRCTAVLAGGMSGGHMHSVLGAAFHESLPIIATCGMDNAVKLWRLPESKGDRLVREDKPLFSSTRIHGAQVLSINWMSKDMLITNGGIVVRRNEEENDIYTEQGTLVLWKWLGLNRFFPPDRDTFPAVMRGNASDFQESTSYKVIAEYNLVEQQRAQRAFIFQTPTHTPLIALPSNGCIQLSSIKHFKPRRPRPIENEADVDKLTEATNNISLEKDGPSNTNGNLTEELPHWVVEVVKGTVNSRDEPYGRAVTAPLEAEASMPKIEACVIAEDGRLLIGVGEKEGIWIWRIPLEKQFRRVETSHP